MDITELKAKAAALPLVPGVYLMKDSGDTVIYVGKSKALKNRVYQYFANQGSHNAKVSAMVSNVDNFEYIICGSEFEALILENSLIKKYMPKYNILLKDDKGYPFIKLTDEPYPRFVLTRKRSESKSRYFGPYPSSAVVKEAITLAGKIFGLPSCKRVFPRDMKKGRPCLNYYIGQCTGVCQGMGREEYMRQIDSAVLFLDGKTDSVLKMLEQQMYDASDNLRFEEAAQIRERIKTIRELGSKQKIVDDPKVNRDVVGFFRDDYSIAAAVISIRKGSIASKISFTFDADFGSETNEMASQFLMQFYSGRDDAPKEILISIPLSDAEELSKAVSEATGKKIVFSFPQRGKKHELACMAEDNAKDAALQAYDRKKRGEILMDDMVKKFTLPHRPIRIEAYDVSNYRGTSAVGAMTVYVYGEAQKSHYRRFRINAPIGDDYAGMREMISRRINEYAKASGELSREEKSFGSMPDLLLIDGGRTHVAAVLSVTRAAGFNVSVLGMVKDDKHRTRAIATENGEIEIADDQRLFAFIGRIQEETHRFAITYQRSSASKIMLKSELDKIEGVGPKRKKALMSHFITIEAIAEADIDALKAADGMNRASAKAVYDHFKNNYKK